MGRSTNSSGQGKGQTNCGWKGKEKKRCGIEGCRKRAKDIIDGVPLCRIHSPMREGFE